jgi:CRP/FNR family cyclic AMP-dependent transcriptional regulator
MPIAFQYLLKFPLLQDLPQDTLMRLSSQMDDRQFARREVLSTKEQTRYSLGFLLAGRLQGVDVTVDGRSVGLFFVEPGDYFGELSVVDGKPAAEHVIAVSKSRALFLEASLSRQLIFEHPSVAQAVMARLSERVRQVTAQRTLLALPNPFQRLCVQLLLLARPSSVQQAVLESAPTHQELAIMINSSRETVTRAFQTLILKQVIERQGDHLYLLDTQFLSDVGNGLIEQPK